MSAVLRAWRTASLESSTRTPKVPTRPVGRLVKVTGRDSPGATFSAIRGRRLGVGLVYRLVWLWLEGDASVDHPRAQLVVLLAHRPLTFQRALQFDLLAAHLRHQ